ncbi:MULTISPECIES: hypothetical protein [Pseudomonas]|uniref:hypothetical protein n=1 Tax=Pseudomonas TaxID=286 RepID=UPI0009FA4D07|nr:MULTISPECIES: hypothetical protein [Pseudomonas]MBI7027851.1 hypothetical protein [Pseudomonas aeruginosa]MBI9170384.1 hypothetical protein [Pseudomonas aeruginosa]MCD2820914.1 hypothetical protein [Pseudomonas aeruginosa]MCD2829467.1 hypothetical protein [Pseudomonas aeruginosa]MCO4018689.1 hypothetical protein [Pseudomonas aeruginosa]
MRDLLSAGFVAPAEDNLRISLGGELQEPSATDSGEERSNDIYFAAVSLIGRTEFSNATVAQGLVSYSLFDHQPAGIAFLLQRTSALLGDQMGLSKTRQASIAAHTNAAAARLWY